MEQQFAIPNRSYKVLCRCYTYNQALYIEDALNGFIMQQTDFPFVCLVVDDCSTDGEQEVIKAFLNRECNMESAEYYEDDITNVIYVKHKTNVNCYMAVYLLKENLYKQKERKMAYVIPWRNSCEYEAMCEGDDYWIDQLKLQKQANYLDSNTDCVCVHTPAYVYNQSARSLTQKTVGSEFNGSLELLSSNKICTLASMTRATILNDYESIKNNWNTKGWSMGDYPRWLCISKLGSIKFINEVSSVYRVLPNSASHFTDYRKEETFIDGLFLIQQHFIILWECPHRLTNWFKFRCLYTKFKLYRKNHLFRKMMYCVLMMAWNFCL